MKVTFTQDQLVTKQLELEAEMRTAGYERFMATADRAITGGSASEAHWNRRLMSELVEPMQDSIQSYLDYYTGRRGKPSRSLTFLKSLAVQEAAYISSRLS